ncbi:MAG TPA: AmmeMemoRadiSam system radical SAM enzyme [Candidatus Dorea intestinavium]|nr:AmmeMemoRadiSam system radical SAM enzyme [Candidatus Dorea intestinavium]
MKLTCPVCFRHCQLAPNQLGFCGARKNSNQEIICDNYGRITAMALDDIEKKPLRLFFPGSKILSVGSYGCNLRCAFCQNYDISMQTLTNKDTIYLSPNALLEEAIKQKAFGNIGAAFTYNEPLISYEYVLDCAKLLKKNDLQVVVVTNGCISPAVLEVLLPFVDAMNIDLKGFSEDYYKKVGGDFESVKAFIKKAAPKCHIELTTLIVPDENDSVAEIEKEAKWIASLSPDIPLHLTRFFPRYKMLDKEATDIKELLALATVARKHLNQVFLGNC